VRKRKAKTQMEDLADVGEAVAVETSGPAVVLSNGRLTAILPAHAHQQRRRPRASWTRRMPRRRSATRRDTPLRHAGVCERVWRPVPLLARVLPERGMCRRPPCSYPAIGSPCDRGSTPWKESAFCKRCAWRTRRGTTCTSTCCAGCWAGTSPHCAVCSALPFARATCPSAPWSLAGRRTPSPCRAPSPSSSCVLRRHPRASSRANGPWPTLRTRTSRYARSTRRPHRRPPRATARRSGASVTAWWRMD